MRSVSDLMGLSGRKALVTGGAGHIGLAVTEALVELGATVSILDVDAAACEKRVERLSALREHSAVALTCDLSDEQETRQAIRETVSRLGGLDILVHCAAYVGTTKVSGWAVPFEQQTVEAWDAAMRVKSRNPPAEYLMTSAVVTTSSPSCSALSWLSRSAAVATMV